MFYSICWVYFNVLYSLLVNALCSLAVVGCFYQALSCFVFGDAGIDPSS